ncbi:hypothetical protein ATG_07380, partial [Desulfurococcaceae archaeon AG1]
AQGGGLETSSIETWETHWGSHPARVRIPPPALDQALSKPIDFRESIPDRFYKASTH